MSPGWVVDQIKHHKPIGLDSGNYLVLCRITLHFDVVANALNTSMVADI